MSYDSSNLTTPDIKWLGVRPSDLDRFNIPEQCRLPMTEEDMKTGKRLVSVAKQSTKSYDWWRCGSVGHMHLTLRGVSACGGGRASRGECMLFVHARSQHSLICADGGRLCESQPPLGFGAGDHGAKQSEG